MKKIYRPFIKGTNWALAGLISLFGFACSSDDDNPGTEEYGTPSAKYSIKGKVITEQNQEPLSDIQVAIELESSKDNFYRDTVFTDTKGEFEWEDIIFPIDDTPFTLITSEKENLAEEQTFIPDTAKVSFKDIPLKNGSRWYEGEASTEITIKLKESTHNME